MEIKTFNTAAEASREAFIQYRDLLEEGPSVFGLATGSTPTELYRLLRESDLDFSRSISFNLDEYLGLPADHPQSYQYFMHEQLMDAKPFQHSYFLNGMNTDEQEETSHYEDLLEKHPIELQLLGLGRNGHIGFNEPGSSFESKTRKVGLTESTIDANKRFFEREEDVPRYAYSMGIGSIMKAEKIILMAFGEDKAEAVRAMVNDEPSEDVPATALQNHDNVLILLDKDAAKLL
ncbi:glucosamine-6-phosphate deaminase [Aerococcus vaginalis]